MSGESRREEGSFLERVYAASNTHESRDLYNEWAKRYDTDLVGLDYDLPRLVAQALIHTISQSDRGTATLTDLRILDGGCGTGMVGRELSKAGASDLTGLDISPGMLEVARQSGAYRKLEIADLSHPISKPDESFQAVVCAGTLTRGHVGPRPVLREFVRITEKRGAIVATVLDDLWVAGGFKAEIDHLAHIGKIEIQRSDVVGITTNSNVGGRLLVLIKR